MFMFFPTNICRGLATKHASIIENIGGIGRDKEMLKKGFFYGPRVSQFLQIPIAIGRDKEMLKKAFFFLPPSSVSISTKSQFTFIIISTQFALGENSIDLKNSHF